MANGSGASPPRRCIAAGFSSAQIQSSTVDTAPRRLSSRPLANGGADRQGRLDGVGGRSEARSRAPSPAAARRVSRRAACSRDHRTGVWCLMFARYLPLLAQCGAYVAVACSPPLRPLFARIAGVDKPLSPPPEQPLAKINLSQAEFDVWLPLLSLPFYFETEFTTLPAEVPYLNIDRHRIVEWRQYYKHVGRPSALKVGLVFHANPASASAVDR